MMLKSKIFIWQWLILLTITAFSQEAKALPVLFHGTTLPGAARTGLINHPQGDTIRAVIRETSYSDEIILYRGERFMPYIDGPVEEHSVSSTEFNRQQMPMVVRMRENLVQAAGIMKSCPMFHPPQGFKLVIHSQTLPPVKFHRNESLSGSLQLELFVTMVCNEKPCYDRKTDATVTLTFNDPGKLAAIQIMEDIWVQPRKVSEFYGHPVYRLQQRRREVTVIQDVALPLYLPVIREDFIMTLIRHFSERIEEEEKFIALGSREVISASSEEIEKTLRVEFEKAYATMYRFDPLLARKLKENYEETERRMKEGYPDSVVHFSRRQFTQTQLQVWQEGIRKLRAELNAMSPSERRTQAHWSEAEVLNTSGLTPPGHPGSNPVARINPAVMDISRPDSDIQLITLEWGVDYTPFVKFRQGRNLQYHKLYELSQCSEVWEQIFRLVKPVTE